MAKTKISEFSATPANNTDIDSINIAEGCAPSGINNAIRELMAQLKDFQTGAVGDSFNGPVGTTTAAAGAFTTLSASSTVSGTGFSTYLASPPAIGGTAAAAGAFTTLTTSSTVTLNGGTANGVGYLDGSKVLTTGSGLVFDGTNFGVGISSPAYKLDVAGADGNGIRYSTGSVSALLAVASSTAFIGSGTNHPVAFVVNSIEQVRLNNTGFGIGNNNPTAKLDVTGTAAISGAVTLSGGTANGVAYLNGSKVLTTGSALTFDGTTFGVNPNVANSTSMLITGTYTGGGTATMLAFQRAGGAVAGAIRYNDTAGDIEFGTTTSHPLSFIYGGSEQMRLTSTGLGIGTSSPSDKLNLAGTSVNNVSLAISNASSGSYCSLSTYGGTAFGVSGWANSTVLESVPASTGGLVLGSYSGSILFQTNARALSMTLNASGNLGLGVTPSAWSGSFGVIQGLGGWSVSSNGANSNSVDFASNAYRTGGADSFLYIGSSNATRYKQFAGSHQWFNAPSGTAGNAISFTQAMTLDASGNLIVGDTTPPLSGKLGVVVSGTATTCAVFKTFDASTYAIIKAWDTATTGNTLFTSFATDANIQRGEIYFNRAAGLTVYATTSDYRAKDILGPVTNSGALIDSVPVYMGKMHGATQERPMFIAHETPSYAHTGEKDAVDADGNPVFQQMDASALVPVMWAEIQSLRARLTQLESK